jgi:apolipoprotein N-acyltransferase
MATMMSVPSVDRPSASSTAAAPRRGGSRERTVEQIIDRARARPARSPARGAWLLAGMSAALLWASFTPLDWGPLAFVALVPLVLLVRLPQPTRWMYRAVYVTGLAGTLAMLQWMRLGHPMMYLALVALALYMAAYFPAFVGAARAAVHRLGVPLTLAVPVIWVALEYLRGHLMTGFAWYFLGHTQHGWIELIQISDVTGAYGVSFLLAASAAALAGLVPASVFGRLGLLQADESAACAVLAPRRSRQFASVAAVLVLFAATLAYGYVRRGQADFSARPGPRVALVQGNFTASVKHDREMSQRILEMHHDLTGKAVRHQPDLIVWPETMYRAPLIDVGRSATDAEIRQLAAMLLSQRTFAETADARATLVDLNRRIAEVLTDLSQQAGAAMIIGLETLAIRGEGVKHYNSAALITPEDGVAGRYDKVHRVAFGEYVPLRDALPFLRRLTPISPAGIDAGRGTVVLPYDGWRFVPMICFEDTVPHLVRRMVREAAAGDSTRREGGGQVDCLVNLTNDGWFHGSSELDQHLYTAAFRAVECRTPMVRAVNTGISAIIDGDGVIREPDVFIDADGQDRRSIRDPRTGRLHKQLNAVLIGDVPLDNRSSVYVAWGDWFAGGCGGLAVVMVVGSVVVARRRRAVGRV